MTESVTFDIEAATASEVLEFARSPDHGDATVVQVFCKFDVKDCGLENGDRGTILLEQITH